MKLSTSQFRAVAHGTGPMLCLAGPGSGKTQVLIQRIKYLIVERKIDPENILVVTFSRAAAMEMRERFHKLEQMQGAQVAFGTFHSIFYAILRHAYGKDCPEILLDAEKRVILKQILNERKISVQDEETFFNQLSLEMAKVKTEELPLEHFYSAVCAEEDFRYLYRRYQTLLEQRGKMEFDDILLFTRDLLKERKDFLSYWQERFSYILVDEYQDINLIQYQVVQMLAAPNNNLFIVGDDDQSIYRFRGARPELMRQFLKDYANAQTVVLEENYRSSKTVVDAAVRLIKNNKNRFLKVQKSTKEEGVPVVVSMLETRVELVEKLSDELIRQKTGGRSWEQMAVLYRTKSGTALLTDHLIKKQIPFQITEGISDIYSHWIAKDLFAYLRLSEGTMERGDFLRVMNRPNRYLSRKALESDSVSFETLYLYYRDQIWMGERLRELEEQLCFLKGQPLFAALTFICKAMGYEDYLRECARERNLDIEELFSILEELITSARRFLTREEWEAEIKRYRENLEAERKRQKVTKDGVILSTLHASKGLEFPFVAITDVFEGTIPHRKAVKAADLEEERRLFYVGVTRAKEELQFYTCKNANGKEVFPSRFLKEMEEDGKENQ